MKDKIIVILISILSLIFVLYYENDSKMKITSSISVDEEIELFLDSMTIEEKIAQMLILNYDANIYDSNVDSLMKNIKPGGFIFMKNSFSSFSETKKFISDLKENSKIPLIISVDQEGGLVQRLKYITDRKPLDIPSMYEIGSTNDSNNAYLIGKVMSDDLRSLGFNLTYAPVLDIYNPSNPVILDRSFSIDKDVVTNMGLSLAKGLEENGIIPVFKHFPGHGDTIIDSHYDLPIIDKTYEEIYDNELYPYRKIINDAKIIMIGHLALPRIVGDNTSASISDKVITDILKNKLGYKGLVITDALNMGALTNYYTEEQIYLMAVNAGVDLLLMPNNYELAIQTIKENVSVDRINESVRKILKFKYEYLNNDKLLDKKYFNNPNNQKIIDKITNK